MIATVNPATGETIKTFEPLNSKQIDAKPQAATETFKSYCRMPFSDREARMQHAAEILETDKHAFARVMTTEMGKPIAAALQEVEKCAWVCRYYAEQARAYLADEVIETTATKSYVSFQPL